MTYRTAITRHQPSAPARWLYTRGLLKGRVLDYGCGKGDIFKFYLRAPDQGAYYDPYWYPRFWEGVFDTIACIYVLNVLPPAQWEGVVARVVRSLAPGGTAYFAVRRDVRDMQKRTNPQYLVELPYPVLCDIHNRFAMYQCQ